MQLLQEDPDAGGGVDRSHAQNYFFVGRHIYACPWVANMAASRLNTTSAHPSKMLMLMSYFSRSRPCTR